MLRDFQCLPRSLVELYMFGCEKIEVLGSIENLTKLKGLDLRNCRSLRDLPCLPRSLEWALMSGCEIHGQVQCLDLVSSLSLIKELDFSQSNLFDNSFPNDWSTLVSLVKLYIHGNKITFLPKCIQTLPKIQELNVALCSKLQSVLGLPESVNKLIVNDNESLEKVQPAQNSRTIVHDMNCPKLCEIEGRYKIRSMYKVDRKVIRYLGLESNAGEEMELDPEVLHEFGIFTTFVSEKQIPSSCFKYKDTGSRISFKVPLHSNSLTIIGFNMCVVLSRPFLRFGSYVVIEVQNKTKDLLWSYFRREQNIPRDARKFALLSLWRCGNLLEGGDEIVIRVFSYPIAVEECCINLIYEDDHEQLSAGERKEAHHINEFDQILWTDKMEKDISDYVFPGKTHVFRNGHVVSNGTLPTNNPHDLIAQWLKCRIPYNEC